MVRCPYLWLKADRRSYCAYPSLQNGCFSARNPHRRGDYAFVSREHQSEYCLTEEHIACPYYIPPEETASS